MLASELLCIPLLSALDAEVSQLSGGTVILMRSRVVTRGAWHGVGHNFPQLASKLRQLCLLGLSRARPEHDVKGSLVSGDLQVVHMNPYVGGRFSLNLIFLPQDDVGCSVERPSCVTRAVGSTLAHDVLDTVWLRASIESFSYKVPDSIH